jgi:autotransporter translocation and assembly factor TamB
VAGIGTDLLAGELSNAIERYAREDIGLDVVEVRSDGVRGATLVAGQYVTPRIFIGLAQPISFRGGSGDTTPQAEAEWRALRWLLVNLQTGGAAFRFFLDGSHGY